jgi:tyrosine-protein phosphatase YwqE
MFHIFNKKRFLVDALSGFVDIHNHILPGIDDGAKTVSESVELIKEFASIGVTNFIATPHIMQDYYPNTKDTIHNALHTLKNELLNRGLTNVAVDAAAEHMIDANFEELVERGEVIPLRSEHLLVEMSYLEASLNFEVAVQKVASSGLFPVLAHPERYGYLHHKRSKYHEYKKNGVLFQLNLLSLSDYYGKEIHTTANYLLDNELIEFVGTDIHNVHQLKALKEVKISKSLMEKVYPIIKNTIDSFY